MKISLSLLREFVEIPEQDSRAIANLLTLRTAEVEEVVQRGAALRAIKICEVKEFAPVVGTKKLNLVQIALGTGTELVSVVCGAPNLRVGMRTAYAAPGTTLPDGKTIQVATLAGQVSHGMLCSEKELGFSENHAGIVDLPAHYAIGSSLVEAAPHLVDTIIEIDNKSLTHRPDLWGHRGFARELSAIYNSKILRSFDQQWAAALKQHFTAEPCPVKVSIDPQSCCLGYVGFCIEGVTVQESPEWLKSRLEALGLRSINTLVDISNYCMLELGQPMHFFDLEKIQGAQINVKVLSAACTLPLIDQSKADLLPGDTVIADAKEPLVVAGIMGGSSSAVSESTRALFVEVGNWKAAAVRRLSQRISVRTDSSLRFEKTLDSYSLETTALRALELLLQFCPQARVRGGMYSYISEENPRAKTISTSAARISRHLGTEVSSERVTQILRALGFGCSAEADKTLKVQVPSFRASKDVSIEADLIEEIGRMIGYDSIPAIPPVAALAPVRLSPLQRLQRKLQDFFVLTAKACEVMTYPLVGSQLLQAADWNAADGLLTLQNSCSPEHNSMRPSIIPSILSALEQNAKHHEQGRLFEVDRIYLPQKNKPAPAADGHELAADFCDERYQATYLCFERDKQTFLETLELCERLAIFLQLGSMPLDTANAETLGTYFPKDWSGLHPRHRFQISIGAQVVGVVFELSPVLLSARKLRCSASMLVLDCEHLLKVFESRTLRSKPIAYTPSSVFDCTVLANERSEAAQAMAALKPHPQLVQTQILSVFPLENAQKAVTLRLTFQDAEKTLSSESKRELEAQALEQLAQAGFPLRGA
jgi:phenylalanyl-tRNA synthetase beta chain